jgi:hypothetical protein
MASIDTTMADKDQLIEFAKTEYKVVIDPRTKIETIRTRVQGLIDGVSPEVIAEDVAVPATTEGRFVKSVVNGNVYEWNENAVGVDFIPCNADGVAV